jgi:hypothetical protein
LNLLGSEGPVFPTERRVAEGRDQTVTKEQVDKVEEEIQKMQFEDRSQSQPSAGGGAANSSSTAPALDPGSPASGAASK